MIEWGLFKCRTTNGIHASEDNSVIHLVHQRISPTPKTAVSQREPVNSHELFLSLVMPAYNEGKKIKHAVTHVLTATYPCRVELIVVDDGSTDDIAAQLSELSCDQGIVYYS